MPEHADDDPSLDLYDRAVEGVRQRIERATEEQHLFTAIGWGLTQLDHAYADTPARIRRTVACRDGCNFCCHGPVDVQAHEVFSAAQYIEANLPPGQIAALIDRLAAHRARVEPLTDAQRQTSRAPCALLQAGSCSIYAGRPAACRAHHTSDATVCQAHHADPTVNLEKVYVPALRARMFAVMLGVDEALESCGYDPRAYDFGSALHVALTDDRCFDRWLQGEAAFPDACLADGDPA